MIPIGDYYKYLKGCYEYHRQVMNLERFFPSSEPYRYKLLKPESFMIGRKGSKVIKVDDPEVFRICYLLMKELPVYEGEFIPYKAQNWKSILPKDYSKLRACINIPPSPAGYYLTKEKDSRSMDTLEINAAKKVASYLFPNDFLSKADKTSYLKKDSSVGIPFHNNSIATKITALDLGYKVAWDVSKRNFSNTHEYVKWLYDEYKLLMLYKIGTRGQLDKPDKVRNDYRWDGSVVEQNKDIKQYPTYFDKLLNDAKSYYRGDNEYYDFISNMTTRRFRGIMIMPPIGTLLALIMRVLIHHRKTLFPHLIDHGPSYNIAALVSPGMQVTNEEVYDADDLYFVSTDQASFDRRWHSGIYNIFADAFDSAVPPPFNTLKHFLFGTAAITQPMNKKDAFTPAFITHDNFSDHGGINKLSNASGSPPTKPMNDTGSTFIMEVLCERMGIGSFVEASFNGDLMTEKFPLSALVNGDDLIIAIKGKNTLDKLLKQKGSFIGEWEIDFDEVPIWNNQKIVKDSSNRLHFIRNHEVLPEKIFKPEREFGINPSGSTKLLPNLGYWARKQEYDTEEAKQIFEIMNQVSKQELGYTLDEIFELTDNEKKLMEELGSEVESINIFEFLSDPQKLMYVSRLDSIPDEIKSLYYFQILPEDFENITSGKYSSFMEAFSRRLQYESPFEIKLKNLIENGYNSPASEVEIQEDDTND